MAGGVRFLTAGPFAALAIIILIVLIALLVPFVLLGITGSAFTRLGLPWIASLAIVILMLLGSFVNFPLYHLRRDLIRAIPAGAGGSGFFTPVTETPVWETVISINLGGGILPLCLVGYLAFREALPATPVFLQAGICTGLVAGLTWLSSGRVADTGLRVPLMLPALAALLAGILLSGGTGSGAAFIALAGGVIGTLMGGNVARLPGIRDLEVPEVSIGGQGTFAAVFLCCVLPALIV